MKTLSRNLVPRLLALLAALILALAQSGAHAQSRYPFSQPALDQMLAPIALYPDALLSQLLMASTYPVEVAEAARWSRDWPHLSGDDAVRAAESQNWDPSVKSLVAFPQLLERMDENRPWMQALGDAFLDQQAEVMDTVQALRRRAEAAGNLRSDERVRVLDSGSGLMLEPLNPQVVYVPYYNPVVVYGSWWWPTHPPVYWRPWPGYYARPGYASGFYLGPAIGISAGFFFGAFDWPRRQVRVVQVNNYYYSHSVAVNRAVIVNRAPGAWRHEPEHRRGMAYRGAEAQQRLGAAGVPQSQGNRPGPADPRRSDARMDPRPVLRHEARPDARFDARRPDAQFAVDTRPKLQSAPAAQPAPVMPTVPTAARSERHRETRGTGQAAQAAPIMQTTTTRQSAPVTQAVAPRQSAPVEQPAPTRLPAPVPQAAATRQPALVPPAAPVPQAAATRQPALVPPAAPVPQAAATRQPAPAVQPAPVMRSAPAVQAAAASRGDRQAAHAEPDARQRAPQGGGSASGGRPAPTAMR